jgi:hypothetical protein
VEELTECLQLFKENELGGDVTIPLASENPQWITIYGGGGVLSGPFAPEPQEQFEMMDRGESVEFEFGMAMRADRLAFLQKLYVDGLLNQEWATWQYDQVMDACAKGIVGCLIGGWWLTNGALQQQTEVTDPSQDWVQIFPPLGRDGMPNTGRVVLNYGIERCAVATGWAQCPEALVALCDWTIKSLDNYLTGTRGIKGKHWEWEGEEGNSAIVDLRSPAPNREYSGMPFSRIWSKDVQTTVNMLPPAVEPKDPAITPRVYKTANTRTQANVPEPGEYPTVARIDSWCPYMFDESIAYYADMETLTLEYFTRIIQGELEVEAGVKEYWDAWMASGGEIRIGEIKEQYDVWIAEHPEWTEPKAFFAPEFWNTERSFPPRKA